MTLPPERRTPIRQGSQEIACSCRFGPAFARKLRRGRDRRSAFRDAASCSVKGVLPKLISASDVGQTSLSAGSGDFPVPGFRVKLSALVREVGKLRNRQARKPALPFGQHALDNAPVRSSAFRRFGPTAALCRVNAELQTGITGSPGDSVLKLRPTKRHASQLWIKQARRWLN